MLMRIKTASLIGLLVALTGCATAPDVVVDQDPAANLSAYKTFAFFERAETDQGRYSTILTQHLKQATRAELERRGYVYDEAAPQLRVNFMLNVEERQELRRSPATVGFVGPRGYRAWGGYDLTTVSYKAGTLRIDLVDSRRNALVWQGLAEGRVGADALHNPGPAIGRVVAEIFTKFPASPSHDS
jgi:Domain of unknown function (DUF4136)